jgi:D-alanine transaminase
MSRIAYVNGHYVPAQHATVSMWDRGHQLADGIYEVIIFFNRKFLDEDLHLARLKRSLDITRIPAPMSENALKLVMREVIRRNPFNDGSIYLQITRGTAKRGHPFPKHVTPSLTMAVAPAKQPYTKEVTEGIRVVTTPDIRWQHCDIKSIALLPNVLANQYAVEQGVREVFMINRDGYITEGSHSNSYMVDKNGTVITHPANDFILNGVRRINVIRIAKELGIAVEERPFTLDELYHGAEAFMTSANTNILPVVKVNDTLIGDGKVGHVTTRLLEAYKQHVTAQTGKVW